MTEHVLIAGCGYVGMRLAEELLARGDRVTGIRRNWPRSVPAGLDAVSLDLLAPGAAEALAPRSFDNIVYAASAGGFSDEAYKRAYVDGVAAVLGLAKAQQKPLKRFVFVSSTGVYGVGQGDEVDEETPVAAGGPFSAARLVEGEKLVAASGLPAVCVRFGGIYGPGRQSLLDSVRDGTARLAPVGTPPAWTNRIHRDDCAGILAFCLRTETPSLLLGVDDEPAPRDEVLNFLAAELGLPPPPVGDPGTGSPQRGNRRCSNRRLRDAGYALRYPTYREGLRALIEAGSREH